MYRSVINLNLYKTALTDEMNLRQQKLYTRIYVILFSGCLSIILVYTAIAQQNISNKYTISSIDDYEHLLSLYQNDINCPCTRISIPYNEFITELRVNTIHQACSTNLVRMALVAGNHLI